MFIALGKLLREKDTLLITVSRLDSEKLRLVITPRLDGTDDADSAILNKPIQVDGTPDELEVDLPGFLSKHSEKVTGLRDTFAQLDQELAAAESAKKTKVAAKLPAKPAAPAAPEPVAPSASKADLELELI